MPLSIEKVTLVHPGNSGLRAALGLATETQDLSDPFSQKT